MLQPRPFSRKFNASWYVQLGKQQTNLGKDEQVAMTALAGQRELFSKLAKIFCEDCPVLLEELTVSVEANDADSARRIA